MATPDSWARAHRTIGSAVLIAGTMALAGATVTVIGPHGATGPAVVTTSVALLVPVVVGVVVGTNQLERS